MAPVLALDPALETRIREIGEALLNRMDAAPNPGLLSKKGAYARLMEWSMKDPAFKTQLFRFVDVLPMLKSPEEIIRHLQEYLGDKAVELSPALKAGLAATSFAPALVGGPVKSNVVAMAEQFVAGESPDDLVKHLRRNAKRGLATTIDLLGETVVSEAEADDFLRRNLEILDTVSAGLASDPRPAFSDIGPNDAALPRLNLSVKVSALTPEVHPADPRQAGTVIGPVIDADAQKKIREYIEIGKREAKLGWQGEIAPTLIASGGYYVPPTIFVDVKPDAKIAREEIFGPVLAVLRARDLDEAFALANDSNYALTAGLFSRSPRALERAERELFAGNIYLNRAITGAIVERHPFGGFRMSGGGTNAGGRGYLENFLFPRAIAENVLRRGFAPDETGE